MSRYVLQKSLSPSLGKHFVGRYAMFKAVMQALEHGKQENVRTSLLGQTESV